MTHYHFTVSRRRRSRDVLPVPLDPDLLFLAEGAKQQNVIQQLYRMQMERDRSRSAGLGVTDKAEFKEEDHPRGGDPEHPNRFSSAGGGGSETSEAPASETKSEEKPKKEEKGQPHGEPPTLTKTEERAWTGKTNQGITQRLGKQVAGKLGEEIALAYLRQHLEIGDAQYLNTKAANYPVDMRGGDHVYEIKTGQASNTKSATQWRATIGEPGDEESENLTQMTREEKAAHNQAKAAAIMVRKQRAMEEVSREVGRDLKPKTLTMILNPDTGVADLYMFDGFHSRIGYNSPLARDSYVGSYTYGSGRSAPGQSGDSRSETKDQAGTGRMGGRLQRTVKEVVLWIHR